MDNEKLKKCPFCGDDVELDVTVSERYIQVHINCCQCPYRGPIHSVDIDVINCDQGVIDNKIDGLADKAINDFYSLAQSCK